MSACASLLSTSRLSMLSRVEYLTATQYLRSSTIRKSSNGVFMNDAAEYRTGKPFIRMSISFDRFSKSQAASHIVSDSGSRS